MSSRRFTERLTIQQRTELWERWRQGESLNGIGRALGKSAGSVAYVLQQHGGIYQQPRYRSPRCLQLAEREEISRGVALGWSICALARHLGRSPSTVSRELARNGGRAGYRAAAAEAAAWRRALRPKPCKLAQQGGLRRIVAQKLRQGWSPQQIAGWLKRHPARDEARYVSHETIYRSLYIQSRGVLKKELLRHLRSQRQIRRSQHWNGKGQGRGQIVDAVSLRERPAEAEDRAVPGHWEGDLLVGANHSYVATLVERRSRFVLLVKLANKNTDTVVAALTTHIKRLPAELRKSLTWDRGSELAQHKRLRLATHMQVYFCDPNSPWQRGSNENTNGLLRQYLPKGTDLSVHTQAELNRIAKRLNGRPRQTLEFRTPAEKLRESIASID